MKWFKKMWNQRQNQNASQEQHKHLKKPKEPKAPRTRKPKHITISVDNATLEFDDESSKDPPTTPPVPPVAPESVAPPAKPEPKAKAKAKPRPKKPKVIDETVNMQVEQVDLDLKAVITYDLLDKAMARRMLKTRDQGQQT